MNTIAGPEEGDSEFFFTIASFLAMSVHVALRARAQTFGK